MSAPKIGRALTSAAQELTDAPKTTLLGVIPEDQITNLTKKNVWTAPNGSTVEFEVPPPPWETDPTYRLHETDARRFVDCPPEITLRWLNPKMVDHMTMRGWEAVPAKGNSLFRLKPAAKAMAQADNTIRKGGAGSDFLAWMYRAWVDARTKQKIARANKATQSAVDRQQSLREQYARGGYAYVSVDTAKHPTHTIGEGKTLTD